MTFVAAEDAHLRVRVAPTHVVAGRATRITVTVTDRYSGRVHRVSGARVAVGSAHAVTGSDGTAHVIVARSRPAAVRVTATKERLLAGRAFVVVRAR